MNTQYLKHQQQSKSVPSPEQNYFVHFAMRYPVEGKFFVHISGEKKFRREMWAITFIRPAHKIGT